MPRGGEDMRHRGWRDLKLWVTLCDLVVNLPRSYANERGVRRNKAGGGPKGEWYGGT
jgi:hypothetical protein